MSGFARSIVPPTELGSALDVALGYRSDDFHRVPTCNVGEQALVDLSAPDRVAEVVEVTDHRRREVEVELPTRRLADPETVAHSGRNEDEGAGRAHLLPIVQEHEVLALEHMERLGSVVVDVQRRHRTSAHTPRLHLPPWS